MVVIGKNIWVEVDVGRMDRYLVEIKLVSMWDVSVYLDILKVIGLVVVIVFEGGL